MTTISVSFENRDMADIAMSRLRRRGIAYKVIETEQGETRHNVPFSPQYYANILFPHQPVNLTTEYMGMPVPHTGMRTIVSSQVLGVPVTSGNEASFQVKVNEENYEMARTIIRNSGGYNMR